MKSKDSRLLTRREVLRSAGSVAVASAIGGAVSPWKSVQVLLKPEKAAAGQARRTLVLGWEQDPAGNLDPPKTLGAHENRLTSLYADTLWSVFGNSAEIKPALAQNWSARDDRTWEVTLKRNLRFQDGTPCDADAVKWTFDRWLDSNHPFHDPPYGSLNFFLGGMQVEKIGPRVLRFHLPRVVATFEANMMVLFAAIVNPAAVQKMGKTGFGQKPICTGAWQITERDRGVRIVLQRNPHYWGVKPRLESLIVKPIVENAQRLAQLQSGDVDMVVAMSPEFVPTIKASRNLQLLETPGNHIWWIALNMHEEPLKKKQVRQALNYAVNKEAIAKTILNDAVVVTPGPIVAQSWANDSSARPYAYDPRRAKELLSAAGYPDGFTTKFWVPESGSGMIAPKEIAQVVQANLKEVGVIAEIVTQEWTSYLRDWGSSGLDKSNRPFYGMGQMSWNFVAPDPTLWLNPTLLTDFHAPRGFNASFYSNPTIDDLLTRASTTAAQPARTGFLRQAQRVLLDDCPWIFMFSAKILGAATNRLKGVVMNPYASVLRLENAEF